MLFCLCGSSPVTELVIGEGKNFDFEGNTDGIEDTDWYVLGDKRTSVEWPFLNWAPCRIITSNVTCSEHSNSNLCYDLQFTSCSLSPD